LVIALVCLRVAASIVNVTGRVPPLWIPGGGGRLVPPPQALRVSALRAAQASHVRGKPCFIKLPPWWVKVKVRGG
jgi:hypothetical protein